MGQSHGCQTLPECCRHLDGERLDGDPGFKVSSERRGASNTVCVFVHVYKMVGKLVT